MLGSNELVAAVGDVLDVPSSDVLAETTNVVVSVMR